MVMWNGVVALAAVAVLSVGSPVFAGPITSADLGQLVLSTSTYTGSAGLITIGQTLPGGGLAVANGAYPAVFNNAGPDGSFGVTSPIFVDTINAKAAPGSNIVNTLNVTQLAANSGINLVTSFSSKSELALNLTPNGAGLTFMGYVATANQLDVSNSNTPGVVEPGNPVTTKPTYRAVALLNLNTDSLQVTNTNAYSGNNGRAVILGSNGTYYMVGNAGNGNGSTGITNGTGVQILTTGSTPADPNTIQAGSYNITQNGYPADKSSKDNNFRGETIFNNTLYVTKGSGSNGIDTVYRVGTAGTLPTGGPLDGPAAAGSISILPGFPTNLAKGAANTVSHPFGIWFANATTLYVADEGDGVMGDAAGSTTAGLEKWSLVGGVWKEDYVLQSGLNLGQNYTVSGTDFAGDSGSYTAATDGLRNLTGQVNADGTVTLYAVTSTVSNSGDQGADPNELVAINDVLSDTTAGQAAGESFQTIDSAVYGQVYRGVALAPTTTTPEPSTWFLLATGFAVMFFASKRRRATRG